MQPPLFTSQQFTDSVAPISYTPAPTAAGPPSWLGPVSQGFQALGAVLGPVTGGLSVLAGMAPAVLPFIGGLGPDGPDPVLQAARMANRDRADAALRALGARSPEQARQILQQVLSDSGLSGQIQIGTTERGKPRYLNFKPGDIEALTRLSRKGTAAKRGLEAFQKFTGRDLVVQALEAASGGSPNISAYDFEGAEVPSFDQREDRMSVPTSPSFFDQVGGFVDQLGGIAGTVADVYSRFNPPPRRQVYDPGTSFPGVGAIQARIPPGVIGGIGGGIVGEALGDLFTGGGGSTCISPITTTSTRLPSLVPVPYTTASGETKVNYYRNMGHPVAFSREGSYIKGARKRARKMLSASGGR